MFLAWTSARRDGFDRPSYRVEPGRSDEVGEDTWGVGLHARAQVLIRGHGETRCDVAQAFAVRGEQFVPDCEPHAVGVMFRMIVSSDRFNTRTSSCVRPRSRHFSNS
jgi:hypothetical protein